MERPDGFGTGRKMSSILDRYAPAPAFDEFAEADGRPRPHYEALAATLAGISAADFRHRVTTVNGVLLQRGVTFTVYADARGTESRPRSTRMRQVVQRARPPQTEACGIS